MPLSPLWSRCGEPALRLAALLLACVTIGAAFACSGSSGDAQRTPTPPTATDAPKTPPADGGVATGTIPNTPVEQDGTPPPPPDSAPTQQGPTPEPPTGSGGAGGLVGEAVCSSSRPGTVEARLRWQPAGPRQRVDLSFRDNDFLASSFEASASLGASESTLTWPGLATTTRYYWRVITFTDGERLASATANFETPDCPQADQRQ